MLKVFTNFAPHRFRYSSFLGLSFENTWYHKDNPQKVYRFFNLAVHSSSKLQLIPGSTKSKFQARTLVVR